MSSISGPYWVLIVSIQLCSFVPDMTRTKASAVTSHEHIAQSVQPERQRYLLGGHPQRGCLLDTTGDQKVAASQVGAHVRSTASRPK